MASPQRKTFYTLDAMRGIAALAVVERHIPVKHHLFPSSYLAVDLFFALSGFVLAHSYEERLRSGLGFKRFMLLRIIRLYPLYIAGSMLGALLFLVAYLNGSPGHQGEANLARFATASLLALTFMPAGESLSLNHYHLYPFDFTAWSLWWELLAGAVFASLAPQLSSRLLLMILSLGGAMLAWSAWYFGSLDTGSSVNNWQGGGLRVLYSFFAGVALYRLWQAGVFRALKPPIWIGPAILLAALTFRPPAPWIATYDFVVAATVFPLLLVLSTAEPYGWCRVSCLYLGAISYPIYAIHAPVLLAVRVAAGRYGVPLDGLFCTILLLALSAGLAFAMHRLYDSPVRKALAAKLLGRDGEQGHEIRVAYKAGSAD